MSHQNVVEFLAKMHSDSELQARVNGLHGEGGPDSVQQLLQVATDAGFPFTERELDELTFAMAANEAGGELTAEQLEAVAGRTGLSASSVDLMNATKEMQEMNMSFNLQYLQLQQQMQSDNRQFTLISNIMKTKHDSAKNAINNVR